MLKWSAITRLLSCVSVSDNETSQNFKKVITCIEILWILDFSYENVNKMHKGNNKSAKCLPYVFIYFIS